MRIEIVQEIFVSIPADSALDHRRPAPVATTNGGSWPPAAGLSRVLNGGSSLRGRAIGRKNE
jgi:hypothetical protein